MKKILLTLFFVAFARIVLSADFITVWNMNNPGGSPTSLTFGVGTSGLVNYTWETIPAGANGSGTISGNTANITGLPVGAMIRITINPTNFNRVNINYGVDKARLIDIEQWGNVGWLSMESAYHGCWNLNISATDIPDLSAVISCKRMFRSCSQLNSPLNINSWIVSNVTDMSETFSSTGAFNQPIGNWDVSNVTDMNSMFYGAKAFNQPIGSWNVSNVTDMSGMFDNDTSFNQPVGNWDVSNVTNMREMFSTAKSFNQPVDNWNTANVTSMNKMFIAASNFNQLIGNWNTSNVDSMAQMFQWAASFNQPIGNWNTSNVTDMSSMFFEATSFNQPIGNWNTGNVSDMSGMFYLATSFNQPIGNWDVSTVTQMSGMFFMASSFNQPIGNWNTGQVMDMHAMFRNADSFNQPIANWDVSSVFGSLGLMFAGATSFNQPLNNWNTMNVTNMNGMFHRAYNFNQSLANWQFNSGVDLQNMLDSCGMDCSNYSATLGGWSANINTPISMQLGAENIKYFFSAQNDRNYLLNTKGWTITGDLLANNNCCAIQYTPIYAATCTNYFFNGQTLTNSGTYYDTLMNANGCDSVITLNLMVNTPNVAVTQTGANLTANAVGASYQWLQCNPYVAIPGEINQTFTATINGDYAVAITENNCTDTSACYPVIGIGFNEQDYSSTIRIFPNPTHHSLQITSDIAFQNASIHVMNILGETIASYTDISDDHFTIVMVMQ
ncbi:MAG: BspA family leucine-rich repeat surface protein [Bacteroidetes bacterium]|nr:BspA family leucine-rich repeat surface protein [Bacteroidota bacterium]